MAPRNRCEICETFIPKNETSYTECDLRICDFCYVTEDGACGNEECEYCYDFYDDEIEEVEFDC